MQKNLYVKKYKKLQEEKLLEVIDRKRIKLYFNPNFIEILF
ncbi:Uncharacterised protein [Candidatus Venteria ishoeyi]|uniref:Uncharacterized protein n=1 Tax=Candidatus Venteria ishoeyi TaxID=1899563 RepID=A0A1H6F5W3_9GAMM|nr:Uncharacterised protein [Candidatus Venteria ishoeyi]